MAGQLPEVQFRRAQWACFLRSLMVFDNALWVNSPVSTYRAEHKAVQLQAAVSVGFNVPDTLISNAKESAQVLAESSGMVAIKGVDTVLVRDQDTEIFGYTNLVERERLSGHEFRSAPAILQHAFVNKLDLRVTVLGEGVWGAAITSQGRPIGGDWRLAKTDADFVAFSLPRDISDQCVAVTRQLGLKFGAIDLVHSEGKFYFLEINPTGEWAWLQARLDFPISSAIATLLSQTEGASTL